MPKTRLKLRHVGDVLVVAVHGFYDQQCHRHIVGAILDALALRCTRAIVVDLRGSLNVMSDAESTVAMHRSMDVREPVAMVVHECLLDRAHVMCSSVWARGRYWVPFVEYGQAMEWAARRQILPSRQSPQSRPAAL